MPSAAYMGMMMMMKVSLSEHAKQPLSLPLPPKVFFHLSFTSLTPCSWLSSSSCEHCVSCTLPIITTILFFKKIQLPSLFCFSLFGSNPTSPDPPYMVLWSCCGLTVYLGPCGDVLYKVLWTHQFVFILLVPILCFFDSVAFPVLLLQLVVNQTREMESKWNFHT